MAIPEAELLAVPPTGDVLKVLVVESLQHHVWDPLECPGLVATGRDLAPEADLLEVGRAGAGCQGVASTLYIEKYLFLK